MLSSISLLCGLAGSALAQGGLVTNPRNADDGSSQMASMPIDLTSMRNNRAFSMSPGDANFDGIHSGYPAEYLPDANLTYSGVRYHFPQYQPNGSDNVLAQGQTITPPKGRYFSIHMLAAAESAVATGYVNATYADNTTTSGPLLVDPFWSWPYPYGGDIIFPYYLTNTSVDYNRSMIYQTINWLDSTKELVSLQLPNVSTGAATGPGGAAEETRLHIFAVTMVPASGTGVQLEVQYSRSTQTWMEGTNKTQIVEVTVNNVGDDWVLSNHSVRVSVSASGVKTVSPAVINRLRPGDRAILQVGVVNTNDTSSGTIGSATVHISSTGNSVQSSPYTFNATYGIASYSPDYHSIYTHESPPWYNAAKYGIFIHWGPYSVPGWGNSGENESYAEWYWWSMNQGPGQSDGTYEYNLETYGPDHVYDDFFPNFTASAFDPKEWVDLFADAGAQYFVQVSKHHDGYALFDLPANITTRTSVAQPPHRNLLSELFSAAEKHHPNLHRATYFSLPEWFHPDYRPYGFGSWPGGNATNPYTNQILPYTGYVPLDDYISDLILPEMLTLADMGTEIMWCDIGGPNLTAEFAAEYYNTAALQGKQVLMDNRCGLPGDFDTPEYASYDAVQLRKWESNLGMDPYSYGYNRATPKASYLDPQGIVSSLVDIVSKNGNFLLDIGPRADGSILEIEKRNLRAAGEWIAEHGEAIFGTDYWFLTPSEGEDVRFTKNDEGFFILSLAPPNGSIVLESPVPYVEGDQVVVVGGGMDGVVVPTRLVERGPGNVGGKLEIMVSQEVRDADRYCWVFKIPYGGVAAANQTAGVGGGNSTTDGYGTPSQPAMQANGAASKVVGGAGGWRLMPLMVIASVLTLVL
ncbi:glycoside hydrolase family 29 protein [Hortaea werneckii]|nr:glycoside hydrolase family 29 protein [Hortaea werneckii]